MSQAVAHMDEMTQQNAALAEESAASADSLTSQIERLNELVATFRTRNAPRASAHAYVQAPASARAASEPARLRKLAADAFSSRSTTGGAPKAPAPRPAPASRPAKAAAGRSRARPAGRKRRGQLGGVPRPRGRRERAPYILQRRLPGAALTKGPRPVQRAARSEVGRCIAPAFVQDAVQARVAPAPGPSSRPRTQDGATRGEGT